MALCPSPFATFSPPTSTRSGASTSPVFLPAFPIPGPNSSSTCGAAGIVHAGGGAADQNDWPNRERSKASSADRLADRWFYRRRSGPPGSGHIITIDVIAPARRFGVGSLLLRAAEDRLHAADCRAVELETAVDNLSALSFYKRHGYSVIRTFPRYYSNGVDALVLEKDPSAVRTEDSHQGMP